MEYVPPYHHAAYHLRMLFSARAVARGGIIRRNITWADREIGHDRLVAAVRQRGFHMVACGGQYVIICDRGPIRAIC